MRGGSAGTGSVPVPCRGRAARRATIAARLRPSRAPPSTDVSYPLADKLPHFVALTRLDRPIGILLLLWPTLVALWFAAGGVPPTKLLLIFVAGTVLTRSAGCAVNDFADRRIDGRVARTRHRPLATGALSAREALAAAAALMGCAFALVLLTDRATVLLSFGALALATAYPFAKRVTHFPQVVLGAAFAFGIPMAFTAVTGTTGAVTWTLFAAAVAWAVAYDTLYAMADREDDLAIGVKSTAVILGRADLAVVAAMHALSLALLALAGAMDGRGAAWFAGLAVAAVLAAMQLRLAADRDPAHCFRAFVDNHRLGLAVFAGAALDFALGGA